MTVTTYHARTFKFIRLLLVGLLLSAWAGLPGALHSAPAATIWYVAASSGNDSNTCTTAAKPCEHIQTAIDKSASGDTIMIAPGTYIEPLTIADENLTLIGQGAASTLLDGSQSFPVLTILRASLPSLTVNISGVTFQNGKTINLGGAIYNTDQSYLTISNSAVINNTATDGGGIYNQGVMKLNNVTVSNNILLPGGDQGGGIYNSGYLELNNVLLSDNQAQNGAGISNLNTMTVTASSIISNTSSGGDGGGIYNIAATSKLVLLNSVLSGNASIAGSGGAIFNNGVLTGANAFIFGNTTTNRGGGIYNESTGRVNLTNSNLVGNISVLAGGGLFNGGIAQIDAGLITRNQADTAGGGLHNAATGKLTVGTSTVITNTALGSLGGGINNLGTLTLTQSALVYNAATNSQGGGLSNSSNAQLTNVTISDNTAIAGGGIQNNGGTLSLQFGTVSRNSSPSLNNASGSVTVGNSIFDQVSGSACNSAIVSAGYNVDRGTSCGLRSTGDIASTDPILGPLQDNGGSSPTRAIAFSSVAVDSAGTCPPPTTDQRGIARPQPQSGTCDRGAYEVVGYNNSNSLDIGANACVMSPLDITDKFYIGRMLVGVNLTYPNRADLTIRLLSPGSAQVGLLGPAANSGPNLDTMFDDSASTIVLSGNQDTNPPLYDNTYKPSTPLAKLRGTNIKGTWNLEICNAGTGQGTLNRWVLVVPEFTNFSKIYSPLIRR